MNALQCNVCFFESDARDRLCPGCGARKHVECSAVDKYSRISCDLLLDYVNNVSGGVVRRLGIIEFDGDFSGNAPVNVDVRARSLTAEGASPLAVVMMGCPKTLDQIQATLCELGAGGSDAVLYMFVPRAQTVSVGPHKIVRAVAERLGLVFLGSVNLRGIGEVSLLSRSPEAFPALRTASDGVLTRLRRRVERESMRASYRLWQARSRLVARSDGDIDRSAWAGTIAAPTEGYLSFRRWFERDAPGWLREHRHYFSEDMRGFGEDAFHAMWYALITSVKPRSFVEIGVYRGQVISLVGLLMAKTGINGEVCGISPFSSHGDTVSNYLRGLDYQADTEANCKVFGIARPVLCKAFSTDSVAVDAMHKMKPEMIYIDGNHDYECVISDVKNAVSALADRGIIVLDDSALFTQYRPPFGATAGHPGPSLVANQARQFGLTEILRVGHNRVFSRL